MARHPTWPYEYEPCELCTSSDPPLTRRERVALVAVGIFGAGAFFLVLSLLFLAAPA